MMIKLEDNKTYLNNKGEQITVKIDETFKTKKVFRGLSYPTFYYNEDGTTGGTNKKYYLVKEVDCA